MSISLQALEAAFSEIEKLGYDEIEFKVGNTTLWMRTLLPEAEQAVQQFASEAWSSDETNATGETMAYVDRFRVDTLARAIVQVGDLDLRGVDYVETGETLPNGKPVKEMRHKVLRAMVLRWGGAVRLSVFRKYTELLKRVEKKAEDAIEFEPSDTQAEIERLESQLSELKEQLEAEKEGPTPNPAYAVAKFSEMDHDIREEALSKGPNEGTATPPKEVKSEEKAAAPVEEKPQGPRRSIIPEAAPPPPQQPAPQPTPPTVNMPPERTPAKPASDGGSFVGDMEMADAIAEENRRLFAARAATGGPVHPPAESALMAVHEARRTPPHVAAAEAAAEIEEAEKARLRGRTEDGVEVFSLPSQTVDLTRRDGIQAPVPPPATRPDTGTRNPRFRPPKG